MSIYIYYIHQFRTIDTRMDPNLQNLPFGGGDHPYEPALLVLPPLLGKKRLLHGTGTKKINLEPAAYRTVQTEERNNAWWDWGVQNTWRLGPSHNPLVAQDCLRPTLLHRSHGHFLAKGQPKENKDYWGKETNCLSLIRLLIKRQPGCWGIHARLPILS